MKKLQETHIKKKSWFGEIFARALATGTHFLLHPFVENQIRSCCREVLLGTGFLTDTNYF